MGGLRALIEAPFMALTASAPPLVQSEIISSLFLSALVEVNCDLNRKNIFISASPIRSLDVCVGVMAIVSTLFVNLLCLTERFVWYF